MIKSVLFSVCPSVSLVNLFMCALSANFVLACNFSSIQDALFIVGTHIPWIGHFRIKSTFTTFLP